MGLTPAVCGVRVVVVVVVVVLVVISFAYCQLCIRYESWCVVPG